MPSLASARAAGEVGDEVVPRRVKGVEERRREWRTEVPCWEVAPMTVMRFGAKEAIGTELSVSVCD